MSFTPLGDFKVQIPERPSCETKEDKNARLTEAAKLIFTKQHKEAVSFMSSIGVNRAVTGHLEKYSQEALFSNSHPAFLTDSGVISYEKLVIAERYGMSSFPGSFQDLHTVNDSFDGGGSTTYVNEKKLGIPFYYHFAAIALKKATYTKYNFKTHKEETLTGDILIVPTISFLAAANTAYDRMIFQNERPFEAAGVPSSVLNCTYKAAHFSSLDSTEAKIWLKSAKVSKLLWDRGERASFVCILPNCYCPENLDKFLDPSYIGFNMRELEQLSKQEIPGASLDEYKAALGKSTGIMTIVHYTYYNKRDEARRSKEINANKWPNQRW